jgi:hypothetical protein
MWAVIDFSAGAYLLSFVVLVIVTWAYNVGLWYTDVVGPIPEEFQLASDDKDTGHVC